jgi:hypothetical protein
MTHLADPLALPGVSATHTWRGGVIVLNDAQGDLPRIKISNIKGLYSGPDIVDSRRQKFGQTGEQATPAQIAGKTITYTGVVQASSLDELEWYCNVIKLAQFTDPQLGEGTMDIVRNALIGGHTYQYAARLVQVEIDDEQSYAADAMPSPWQRTIVMAFRLSDPRIYVTDDQQVLPSAAGPGGANITLNVANPGGYDAVPVIRILGPTVQPILSRAGAVLAFSFTLGAGEWADVDFETRTVTKSDGTDLTNGRIVAASTWWDAGQPGIPGGVPAGVVTAITLSQAAGHPGVGSGFTVTFDPAV